MPLWAATTWRFALAIGGAVSTLVAHPCAGSLICACEALRITLLRSDDPRVSFARTRGTEKHRVRSLERPRAAPATAYLEWTRVAYGKALGRARAVTGTVTYLDGPTNEEEWRSVAVATTRVSVSFERDPLVKSNRRVCYWGGGGAKRRLRRPPLSQLRRPHEAARHGH
jgi:hypothetical protein